MSVLADSAAWLFCPADRPDRYGRAIAAAGVVIIDLEDAVAAASKDAARAALLGVVADLDPSRVIVRVNPIATAEGRADLEAVRDGGVSTVMVPMIETAAEVVELDGLDVIALCETPAGILAAATIAAAPNCVALTWGIEDLSLELAAVARDASGRFTAAATFARSAVRYAAAAARIPAYDTVWADLDDTAGLEQEARDAAAMGYRGKLVVHPRQVAAVRGAFRPTDEQVAWAARIIEAAAGSDAGVVAVDGHMLDRPIVERARRILERADR